MLIKKLCQRFDDFNNSKKLDLLCMFLMRLAVLCTLWRLLSIDKNIHEIYKLLSTM